MVERDCPPRDFVVEVVYALPQEQAVVAVRVSSMATAVDAVRRSGLLQRFPEIDLQRLDVGIFGRSVTPDQPLRSGDRVEIYRPLLINPKEMRRRRAAKQGRR